MGYILTPPDNRKRRVFAGRPKSYFSSTNTIFHKRNGVIEEESCEIDVLCKYPKKDDTRLAIFEVFASEMSVAMIGKKRTSPRYFLTVDHRDHSKIVGIASQVIPYEAFRDSPKPNIWEGVKPVDIAAIAMWDCIAQEEDKNKENIGKNTVLDTLAEIDHDMKDYQPIYSRFGYGRRWLLHPFSTYRHGLTTEDLRNFPFTKAYRSHYWFAHRGFDLPNKYYNKYDVKAMAEFSTGTGSVEFVREKFYMTLKWILFPETLIKQALGQHRDETCDLYWLYVHTKKNRQAEIQAIALGTAEFRAALTMHKGYYINKLHDELKEYCDDIRVPTPDLTEDLKKLCDLSEECEKNQDTPLHAAIRAHSKDGKSFRYEETLEVLFEYDINVRNNRDKSSGQQTAAELAVELGQKEIAQFLIDHKAIKPKGFVEIVDRPILAPKARDLIRQLHLHLQGGSNGLDELDRLLKILREDTTLSLKMRKNTAILLFKQVMPHINTYEEWQKGVQIFNHPLNNFTKQVTSRWEWVRALRGNIYDVTDTSKTISDMFYAQAKLLIRSKKITDKNELRETRKIMRSYYMHTHSFFGGLMKTVKIELPTEFAQRQAL